MAHDIEAQLQRLRVRYVAPLARPIAAFWSWWTRELIAALPTSVGSALANARKKLLVTLENSEIVCSEWHASSWRVIGRHVPGATTAPGFAMPTAVTQVILSLPPAKVLVRTLTFPLAAEENLREVLSFELDRQTPFTAAQAYYDYCITARAAPQGSLTVDLVVTPRQLVDDLLVKLRDLGISPDIITTQAADGDTLPVNLLPQSTRPTRRFSVPRLNTVLAGIAVLLLVTAMLLPPLLGKRTLEDLQQQLQVAEAAAADGLALRRDVERLTLASTFLVTKKKTTVPVLQMLAEVSRILPDDTWLTRVDVNGPELQLRGQSSAAAALIELLESSALFRDARFRSPVVQVPATNSERFHLSVVLETPEAT